MPKKMFTPEQFLSKLRQISGMTVYGLLLGLQAFRSLAVRYDCTRISGL